MDSAGEGDGEAEKEGEGEVRGRGAGTANVGLVGRGGGRRGIGGGDMGRAGATLFTCLLDGCIVDSIELKTADNSRLVECVSRSAADQTRRQPSRAGWLEARHLRQSV